MVEDHLKAVLKSEVMEHHFDRNKPVSMISMYSSNSSQDDEDDTEGSTRKWTPLMCIIVLGFIIQQPI